MIKNLTKFMVLLSVIVLSATGVAQACPDWRQDPASGVLRYDGDDLWNPKTHNVVAGGDQRLDDCGISHASTGERAVGYTAFEPDFELQYGGGDFQLELKVVSACDSTLLINTGAGNWYFDDDDLGNGDARICLTRPTTGVYDIWIGTYGNNTCDAQLILESWQGGNCTQ